MAIGYKSYVHMGWHAKHYFDVSIDACPFPPESSIAKEWRLGFIKAQKGEPWGEPLRKKKRVLE